MAVDPTDDETRDHKGGDEEDESDLVPIKRQPKSLLASKSLPSVSSALDDFIISANQKLMDVAEFTPETREQGLRDEIAELKKKLATAESKAAAAAATEAPAPAAGGRSWGAIIGAFVVGAGLMFAIGKLTAPSAPAAEATPTAVAPSQPPASPTPVADPVAHEPSAPTTATAATPPSEPVATPTPPTVAVKQSPPSSKTPKPAKTPSTPTTPKQPKQPVAGQDGSASKPPPAGDGSGGDLYNPF